MDLRWLGSILIGAGCLALGYLLGSHRFSPIFLIFKTRQPSNDQLGPGGSSSGSSWKSNNRAKEPLEIERLLDVRDYFDLKMVLVVRNDLKMGKGKIAAQCSHATLGLYKKLFQRAPKALSRWEMCAQPKVVLKIESEEEMLVLQEKAKSLKLPTHITIDAGRTQIAPNSRTVMAILGPVEVVDDVTGGLKLL